MYSWRNRMHSIGVLILTITTCSGFLSQINIIPNENTLYFASASVDDVDVHDLQSELDRENLNHCHGILHSTGVREIRDLMYLTDQQICTMAFDRSDQQNILRVKESLLHNDYGYNGNIQKRELSTERYGAFDRKVLSRFEIEEKQDFALQTISYKDDVYKGKLFSIAQCQQLNRMSEYYAYNRKGIVNGGWSNHLYTLTSQHMKCEDIPGMTSSTKIIMRQLVQELYTLFPEIRPGSISFNDGEPHLVKYNGKCKGTAPHIDNSTQYKYITVNAMLSADDEYSGGGTYISNLDETIRLQQGEMLIHLGDLVHAGVEIRSGVRRLFIAFLACEWEHSE